MAIHFYDTDVDVMIAGYTVVWTYDILWFCNCIAASEIKVQHCSIL